MFFKCCKNSTYRKNPLMENVIKELVAAILASGGSEFEGKEMEKIA